MAGNFGELVLVLGDLHIPQRASLIPEKFKRMLVPNKMQHVLCTGNIGSRQQYEELRNLAPNVHITAGDYEYNAPTFTSSAANSDQSEATGSGPTPSAFPESKVITVGEFRIGLLHGHQIVPAADHSVLDMQRRKMDVDILIHGHTHRNEVVEYDRGAYHINPGSITGAWSTLPNPVDKSTDITPSFVLLAVQGNRTVCYVYELINGEVDVSKTEFSKRVSDESDGGNPMGGGLLGV